MELINSRIELNWPNQLEIYDLRHFIIKNISKKGDIVRWSITKIKKRTKNQKIIFINAVIII